MATFLSHPLMKYSINFRIFLTPSLSEYESGQLLWETDASEARTRATLEAGGESVYQWGFHNISSVKYIKKHVKTWFKGNV